MIATFFVSCLAKSTRSLVLCDIRFRIFVLGERNSRYACGVHGKKCAAAEAVEYRECNDTRPGVEMTPHCQYQYPRDGTEDHKHGDAAKPGGGKKIFVSGLAKGRELRAPTEA
ncbi:hypothetical protein ABW19_dt0210311 [Dactylella cylindrospora]|nr:hypothetical protein ABW19_dt0210311 [Dactylella cylindrospora]